MGVPCGFEGNATSPCGFEPRKLEGHFGPVRGCGFPKPRLRAKRGPAHELVADRWGSGEWIPWAKADFVHWRSRKAKNSLPEFMDFILFGKTILVVNKKFGLFLANQLRKRGKAKKVESPKRRGDSFFTFTTKCLRPRLAASPFWPSCL